MKQFTAVVAMTVFFCICSVLSACADEASVARQAIQTAYDRENAAMARKDAQGAVAYTDPGFTSLDLHGQTQTYAERCRALPYMFALMKKLKMDTRIRKFALTGSTADTQVITRLTLTVMNQSTHQLESGMMVQVHNDRWVKSSQGWMLLYARQLESKRIQ